MLDVVVWRSGVKGSGMQDFQVFRAGDLGL